MSGPAANLLLRQPLTEDQIAELEGWLAALSEHKLSTEITPNGRYTVHFCVDNLSPFIRDAVAGSPLFTLSLIIPDPEWETYYLGQDQTRLIETFEYLPVANFFIRAGSKHIQEHKILAQLLIELAGKYKADMFDLGGEIRDLPDLPGKVVKLPYELDDDTICYVPIVDVEFLKNWLNHPDFYLPG